MKKIKLFVALGLLIALTSCETKEQKNQQSNRGCTTIYDESFI